MDFSLYRGSKKHAVFVTPVMPTLHGRGPGFRAYQWVCFLAKYFEKVTVLCTSVYGFNETISDEFLDHKKIQVFISERKIGSFRRFLNILALKPSTYNFVNSELENWLVNLPLSSPDFVAGFKITSYPVLIWLKRRFKDSITALDIDEVNSKRVWDILLLMKKNGLLYSSYKLLPEVIGYRILESALLYDVNHIIVSTEKERVYFNKISAFRPCNIFENRFPAKKLTEAKKDGIFQFLFVGNSIHYPNRDAIETILFEILPQIKRGTANKFKIVIVGGVPNASLRKKLHRYKEIEYLPDTDDLDAIYRKSHAALIPLRSGGGSSLKVLEALANKKVVVSTEIGIRGFKLVHKRECLVSNDMSVLAGYCSELIDNKEYAGQLSQKGYDWFVKNQSYIADFR